MKKLFTFFVLFCFVGLSNIFSQTTLLSEGFEGSSQFTVENNDGDLNAWTTVNLSPRTGLNCKAVNWNTTGNNDWLISPTINLPADATINYSFYAKSEVNYPESFVVRVSVDGVNFNLLDQEVNIPSTYTQFTYNLSAYAGSQVKVAIICVSVDMYRLSVDDILCNYTANSAFLPTVTTTPASSITFDEASSGGNVTSDGNTPVTARGVCWSTSVNPTTSNSYTTDGSGVGTFNSSLNSLIVNTTYHIRAYATNSVGTAYGNDVTFNTLSSSLLPTVITTAVSAITANSFTSSGNVISDGGYQVTNRGFCRDFTSNPTIYSANVISATTIGIGTFGVTWNGLSSGTTYHIRAYATNLAGTAYGEDTTVTTLSTITTTAASAITANSASSGGIASSIGGAPITAKGVCWSTSVNPSLSDSYTTDGSGVGPFTSSLTNLSGNTTYHIRAYVTNSGGTAYGNDITFTTLVILPTVSTTSASAITSNSASAGGNVTSIGTAPVTARGVCWSSSVNPTTSNSFTSNGSGIGTFTSSLSSLSANTTYHIRAYATSTAGTAYGDDLTFTTLATPVPPTVTTTAASAITSYSASAGGNVTALGNVPVTARGVCWSMSVNPTTSDSYTTDGSGLGTFTSSITGLNSVTTYHIRAYATNSAGTAYGDDLTFTTLSGPAPPAVTTTSASSITTSSASAGGNVTSIGTAPVTAKGVCWSTSVNPTTSDSYTTDGSGLGTFTSSITGLSSLTTYHIRAYATNSVGTAYGSDLSFTTNEANSTQVFATNIAFTSLVQEPNQTDIPPTMIMNSSNPENYINPGNLLRFKIQCINNLTTGAQIFSGLCKITSNDPYLIITDSTSGLNNVDYDSLAWSTNEFEVQIQNNAPLGHVSFVNFVVIEGSNNFKTFQVPIPIAPLSLQERTIDDDNNPDSQGNTNGICDPNEIIETLPSLQNASTLTANKVEGTFYNCYGYSGISIWNDHPSESGANVQSTSDWNVLFGVPNPITAGSDNMKPKFDFVFDYNITSIRHFYLGLNLSGKFDLFDFDDSQTFIKWLVPIEYNYGYPEAEIEVGISDINASEDIVIYPNPANEKIEIIGIDNGIIEIMNLQGQIVETLIVSNTKSTIDVSKLSDGVYTMILKTNKGITAKKLVIQ